MYQDPNTLKNTYTSNTAPHQATIVMHLPKLKSVQFEDPYYHINYMDNNHDENHLIDTQE